MEEKAVRMANNYIIITKSMHSHHYTGCNVSQTIKKILEINPEAKAIVSSGYSNDPIMSDYKVYGFRGIIKKPYVIEELSKVLHEVIIEPEKFNFRM